MPLSKLRILVVDDYEPLRFLKTRLLSRAGAVTLEARTGRGALRTLASERVDMVLLDINLPDMSGMEVRKRMRADAATAELRVIYTSVSARPPELDAGNMFFQEPLDKERLIETALHPASTEPSVD